MTNLRELIDKQVPEGGLPTVDVLRLFLPLVHCVIETHDRDMVSPLAGLRQIQVHNNELRYAESDELPPRLNSAFISRIESNARRGLLLREPDGDAEGGSCSDVLEAETDQKPEQPCWVCEYQCWEHLVGHHDPATDIFILGQILASLSCGLNFYKREHLEGFVQNRRNLFRLRKDLHPVIARIIVLMTQPDRIDRPQDLPGLLAALQDYRDLEVDFDTDLASTLARSASQETSRRQLVLSKLRERLFEINRRNRLLHFRATSQSVNLTQSSVPLSDHAQNLRTQDVITWAGDFAAEVTSRKPVLLNRHLNFREAAYLPGVLDRIRMVARRDQTDFGFAQLRLVLAMLRWADLKQVPAELYESPLLLLPVQLTVKKGIQDRYLLQATETAAEVNPVVRHQFKELYGIQLPEFVELTNGDLDKFVAGLSSSVQAGDASIGLDVVTQPRFVNLQELAQRRLDKFRNRSRASSRSRKEYLGVSYSYSDADFKPLGRSLFDEYVRPSGLLIPAENQSGSSDAALAGLTDLETGEGWPASVGSPPVVEKSSQLALADEVDENPSNWELDFCCVTLANLRYRRMSLGRDFDQLIADDIPNPAFDAAFEIEPQSSDSEWKSNVRPLGQRFEVMPADPTQAAAVGHAESGHSYIIQGPPGTGKSQTIANLIADFVMRGKRILFVCEKRAAVDVVYLRLKQRGLQSLCCLIHDTQADKKQFVMDLKETWHQFVGEKRKRHDHLRNKRDATAAEITDLMKPLALCDELMQREVTTEGPSFRELIDELLISRDQVPELVPVEWEQVPPFAQLHECWGDIVLFEKRLRYFQPDGILASHPIRFLSTDVVSSARPVELVVETQEKCLPLLHEMNAVVERC